MRPATPSGIAIPPGGAMPSGGIAMRAESSTAVTAGFAEPPRDPWPGAPAAETGDMVKAAESLVGLPLEEVDRLVIEATIRACGGSLPKAARVLGVSPSTLYRKRAGWTDRLGGEGGE